MVGYIVTLGGKPLLVEANIPLTADQAVEQAINYEVVNLMSITSLADVVF